MSLDIKTIKLVCGLIFFWHQRYSNPPITVGHHLEEKHYKKEQSP